MKGSDRTLSKRICAEETNHLKHILWDGPKRTFAPSFYEALEREATSWTAQLINRAALFARSREFAMRGEVDMTATVALCEADVNNAWDLLQQEDAE